MCAERGGGSGGVVQGAVIEGWSRVTAGSCLAVAKLHPPLPNFSAKPAKQIRSRAPPRADFSAADEFLNSPATRKALGVGDREWVSCNMDVYMDMAGDWLHRWAVVLCAGQCVYC